MSETEEKMKHLDEMTCLLYLERQLDRARGLEVSLHTQECENCRTLLRALERESRLLTRAMFEDNEPLPSRLAQFQQAAERSMQWIWGLAFGLAATGVYALYTQYIEPWQAQLQEAGFSGTNLLGLLIFQSPFWKGWQSMITVLEILAVATLGGLGVMFLRRRIRRGSALALVFASLCAALLAPAPASATEFRKGDRITIVKDEVVHSDLYVAGGQIRIAGTIEGDLVVAGGDVEVSGHVMGDMLSASGQVRMTGQVEGSIRGYAGNITLKGKVGRNVMTFGGDVNIDHDAVIAGSVTTGSGRLSLDGHVARDLLAFAGQSNISGDIGGAVKIRGGGLNIASSADIWMAGFILYGLVLYSLMPKFSQEAVKSAEQYGASAGLGVLVLFGVPIAACIACITVVGLFIGISTLFVWYAALYFAQIIVGTVVGQWLMGRTGELWPTVGRKAVGVVIVRVCTTIPDVGGWVKFVAILWGIGAISLAIFRRFQPVPATGVMIPPGAQPLPPTTTVGGPLPA